MTWLKQAEEDDLFLPLEPGEEVTDRVRVCPYCHKKVNKLQYYHTGTIYYDFYVDEVGNEEDNETGTDSDGSVEGGYCCPRCGRMITNNRDQAHEFLTGEWDGIL